MPDGSDKAAGKVVGTSRLTWSNWKRTSPDEVFGIKNSTSIDAYMAYP